MSIQLHETQYGKSLFEHQIPILIKEIANIGKILETYYLKQEKIETMKKICNKPSNLKEHTILDDILAGDWHPEQECNPNKIANFHECNARIKIIEMDLIRNLNHLETQKLLEQYKEFINERTAMEIDQAFKVGYQTAMKLVFAGMNFDCEPNSKTN